jgi:hypothetical protein
MGDIDEVLCRHGGGSLGLVADVRQCGDHLGPCPPSWHLEPKFWAACPRLSRATPPSLEETPPADIVLIRRST